MHVWCFAFTFTFSARVVYSFKKKGLSALTVIPNKFIKLNNIMDVNLGSYV